MSTDSVVDPEQERRARGSQKSRRHKVTTQPCPVCGFNGLQADLAQAITENPALCTGASKRNRSQN